VDVNSAWETIRENIKISAKESLGCKIWGFHGGDYEEWSSGMLRRVALVRTDVSEELSASFIRVTRICELGTTLAVTNNRCTLRRRRCQVPLKRRSYKSHMV
jgi:hypothetical protein